MSVRIVGLDSRYGILTKSSLPSHPCQVLHHRIAIDTCAGWLSLARDAFVEQQLFGYIIEMGEGENSSSGAKADGEAFFSQETFEASY